MDDQKNARERLLETVRGRLHSWRGLATSVVSPISDGKDDSWIVIDEDVLPVSDDTDQLLNPIQLSVAAEDTEKEMLELVAQNYDLKSLECFESSVPDDEKPRYLYGERYVPMRTIGFGSFSKVKLALDKLSGKLVALKMVDKRRLEREANLKRLLEREISILKKISHRNLVKLLDIYEEEDFQVIVLEWIDGAELFEIVGRAPLSEERTRDLFTQLVESVKYLHENNVIHRDLKLENIMVEREGRLVLLDFGLASHNSSTLWTRCGSTEYAAPEMLLNQGLLKGSYDGMKTDCWSLGVILYACLSGRLPFEAETQRHCVDKICAGLYDELENSPDAKDLCKRLLTVDSKRRYTIDQILEHPFLARE